MIKYLTLCFVIIFAQSSTQVTAQCTEAKDAEMAKYMKLTKTQDAQGCSQCGMLALYFCSAKYSVKPDDVQKVGALIEACKTNIRNMGQPYCCPDYLNKEPEWGIMAGNTGNKKTAGSGTASLNDKAKSGNSNATKAVDKSQKLKQTEEVLNAILKQLETDPANPLSIDTKFLNDFSGMLPEGSLKNTLQSYGSNLGTDGNLSLRQIYWDVAAGFKQNPTLISNSKFSNTAQGLNIMLDNFTLLSNKLKSNGAKYEFGAFMNDPQLINSLSNITGSYETAQALGNGIELISMFGADIAEAKKMKEDYKKLAKLSTDYLYIEKDLNLAGALIDACLEIVGHQIVTPIYRYDFNNGASLRVENGILKYFNAAKDIIKNLMVVDKRHDGKFYKSDDRGYQLSTILISPDEKVFYIYVNPDAISDIKCKDCLIKCGHTIDSENGEIIYKIDNKYCYNDAPSAWQILNDARFNKNNILITYPFAASGNLFWTYKNAFTSKEKQSENMEGAKHKKFGIAGAGLDKTKKFIINNKERKFKTPGEFSIEPLFDLPVKFHYVYEKDSSFLNLFWGGIAEYDKERTIYSSSMLQVAKNEEYYNADGMINELTGIAMSRSGDLYFANHNGYIGKMKGTDYKLNDPSLTSNMRKAMDKKIFASYNFIASKSYVSLQGLLRQDDTYSIYPAMKLTPDEKLLTYTVNDHLYIVNPDDLSKVNHYKLGCQPYNYFFTKENGDWVINLQSLNEFKFPVTKKYSIPNMLAASEASKKPAGGKILANDVKNNFSLADELKKLKELMDSGAITKDEYNSAKKQLLNK